MDEFIEEEREEVKDTLENEGEDAQVGSLVKILTEGWTLNCPYHLGE